MKGGKGGKMKKLQAKIQGIQLTNGLKPGQV